MKTKLITAIALGLGLGVTSAQAEGDGVVLQGMEDNTQKYRCILEESTLLEDGKYIMFDQPKVENGTWIDFQTFIDYPEAGISIAYTVEGDVYREQWGHVAERLVILNETNGDMLLVRAEWGTEYVGIEKYSCTPMG